MTPTNELRWVIREKREPWPDPWNMRIDDSGQLLTEKVSSWSVLQQKWATYWSEDMGGSEREFEWLDVPTVKEST